MLRVPLPWFPWGNRLVGSFDGGWIATASGSERLLVVNLFTGVRALSASRVRVPEIRLGVRSGIPSADHHRPDLRPENRLLGGPIHRRLHPRRGDILVQDCALQGWLPEQRVDYARVRHE